MATAPIRITRLLDTDVGHFNVPHVAERLSAQSRRNENYQVYGKRSGRPANCGAEVKGSGEKDCQSHRRERSPQKYFMQREINLTYLPFKLNTVGLLSGTVILIFLVVHGHLFPGLISDWQSYDPFSHGYLIPFIAGYMVWRRREALVTLSISPSALGAIGLFISLMFGVFGHLVDEPFIMRISMVLSLGGLIYLMLGRAWLRELSFPIFYLLLMIPLPYLIVKEVAYYLRLTDATITGHVLAAIGIPVFRDGYFLHLPNITLEVADLCSGVTSIFALFAIGMFYAWMQPVRASAKLAMAVSTILFATSVNLIRIIVVSILVYVIGPVVLGHTEHTLTGTITFFVALILFILFWEVLQRKIPIAWLNQKLREGSQGSTCKHDSEMTDSGRSKVWLASLYAISLLIGVYYLSGRINDQVGVPLRKDIQLLPEQLGVYTSASLSNNSIYTDPNAEVSISRIYETPDKSPIELFIGYRSTQRASTRLGSPKLKFPQGWNSVDVEIAGSIGATPSGPIQASWILAQKGEAKKIILYWYETRDSTIATDLAYRWAQMKSLLLHRRTAAAVVRLATPVSENEKIGDAKQRVKDFAVTIYPVLVEYLPK
jgi:EpsI family protein